MSFCTNCGESLSGAKQFCASCGFRVPASSDEAPDPNLDRTSVLSRPETQESESPRREEEESPARPPRAPQEPEFETPPPPKPPMGEEEPMRDRAFLPHCHVCNKTGDDICIFCEKGLCKEHSKKMAIMVNNMPASRIVGACESCSKDKIGQVPTVPEAKEADHLYSIKPHHEWGLAE